MTLRFVSASMFCSANWWTITFGSIQGP